MKTPTHLVVFLLVIFVIGSVQLQSVPPQFQQNIIIQMAEDKANGSLITSFDVTDRDHNIISLGIFDDFTRSSVYLNETNSSPGSVTGNIYLINPDNFDFDRGKHALRLAFTAYDGQNTVTGFVEVYVTDVNDNPPVFRRPAYIYAIPENTTYTSTHSANISATDDDDGVNQHFTFRLTATGQSSDLYKDVFNIDPGNGSLILNKPLDYETLSFYQYTIEAVDSGNPSMTGSAEITIKVTDVQDTPPNFQRLPYLFTIQENSSWAGVDILALDGDRGIPRTIQYSLNESECSKLFELTTTGRLSLKHNLDRDTGIVLKEQGVCRFDIEAKEVIGTGEPTTNSTASTTVTVMVDDIDDNVPTFNQSHYDAYVQEEVSNIPMTIVGSTGIEVFDLDQGSYSLFNLAVKYTNGTEYVGIEAAPSLILSRATFLLRLVNGFKFDYETEQTITLYVVAMETTNTSMSATCTVNVTINNTNDNDPKFGNTDYNGTIPENPKTGTSVTVVTADDDDLGKYGELSYTLKGSSLFNIDPYNGTVYTAGNPCDLDRETRNTYYLTVVATDGGGRRAVSSLTVTLSDVNDNTPVFLYEKVEMSINENTKIFTPNILITATDRDEINTRNSEVMYRLGLHETLGNNFTINNTTGELIATQALDYEHLNESQNGQIHLTVIAYDLGEPPLTANTNVTITVHDENDNTPRFQRNSSSANIAENSLQGNLVTNVSATDDDATSPNNKIRYYIEKGGSDMFRINGTNGVITVDLNAKFDREQQDLYKLTVIAADIGTPPHTGTVTVSITITDINDERPVFNKTSYTADAAENKTVGAIVKTCNAYDVDEDKNLEYHIIAFSATNSSGIQVNFTLVENKIPVFIQNTVLYFKNMFDIHHSNGSVFVENHLDRETASQIVITVLVNDTNCAEHCPQTSTALLTVNIRDVNDVPPMFSQKVYNTSVLESSPKDTNVITVTATDVDTVGGGPFYTVLNSGVLTIKDRTSGTITTKSQKLDRETQPELNITVTASDGVNNSTCIVIVTVTDVNDNAPAFLPYADTVNITEGNYTNNPYLIARVNATDADEGSNAVVTYRLEDDFNGNFTINDTTGDIWAIGDIDRETSTPVGKIELTIIAENPHGDSENLQNKTKLTITVLDVNDNNPTFSRLPYEGTVLETKAAHGTQILQVAATDPDNGINGTDGITYGLQGTTNGTSFFYINDTTGYIYANSTMVNNVGKFLLNVTASDGGEQPLMSSMKVYVTVTDENNNPPIFNFTQPPGGPVILSMLECMPNGSKLTKINATDADEGANGEVSFSFVRESGSDPGPFHIENTTGWITLNGIINNANQSEYKVIINAADGGTPSHQTTRSREIQILIKDVNDHLPEFRTVVETAHVMENTNNVEVCTVTAYDEDADSFTNYQITEDGECHRCFKVDKTTGVVTIEKALDRENTTTVQIKLKATDASLRNESCSNGTDGKPVAGNDTLTDTLTLIVALGDENDNPPVFKRKEFDTGIRKNVKLDTSIFDFVDKVSDKDTAINSVHSFEIQGKIVMPGSITAAVHNRPPPKCKDSVAETALCLSSNGTVTTNMMFEENMAGTMIVTVVARDEAGNDTAILKIDIIVDNQMAKMIFHQTKQQVEDVKFSVTEELTNLTGYIFVPDEVSAYTKDDGTVDDQQSILTFYVKEPRTGRILTAQEIKDLVDKYGDSLVSVQIKYRLVSIEEAFKTKVDKVDEGFKQTMILVGATVLEAVIICILVAVACRSQGKFKRKLKAATVTTKGEKDSSQKKSSIIPGSNVYASMTNPILNKDVPLPAVADMDTMSDTDSQNSLDSNEVGTEGLVPDYRRIEEKEAVMDMYTEDYYQPDTDVDPLQMVLSMHEMEKKEHNGDAAQLGEAEDDSQSDFRYDFDNSGLQLETTEV